MMLDELKQAFQESALAVQKLEVLSETVHVRPGSRADPLSKLGLCEVTLTTSAAQIQT